jgi:predicted Zn-dependent protease
LYQGNQQAKQLAANNLAMLLATYKADQASLDQARDLTAVFASSDNGSLLDTSGWVRFKRGEFRDALPLLERATTRAPDSRVIRYHLAMTELRLGLKDRARTNLQSALAGQVNFTGSDEARTTLAALEPHSG